MKIKDILELVVLASLWGGSFLFMRISVPEFGAVPMMAVRVALAGGILLPLVIWKGYHRTIINHWLPISIVGIIGSALPFSLIAYSTIHLTAGFASVLNAATPMFAAMVAFVWLKQRLNKAAIFGLLVGLSGVVLLVWDKLGFTSIENNQDTLAIIAGLAGTLFYGMAANYSRKKLVGVSPLAITTGSLLAAAIVLAPFAVYWWPEQQPSSNGWFNVIALAVACTAVAQIIYFRLIESSGATNATSVTFLIPIFGLLWGNLFLNEVFVINTLIAGGIILVGTGMTTGIIKLSLKKRKQKVLTS